jgi:sugar-specific transcriptional regulator TrmB
MNEKILEEIGLTKGEIKVYFTLLKLGETTTGRIIEEAQISSGKIYEILDKLIRKGLASFMIKEKTKYFSAASPNRILDYLHEKERLLKYKEQQLLKELPSLLALEKARKKRQEINMFRGFKGIKTAIYEALEDMESGVVLAMGIRSSKKRKYNNLWKNWHRERVKKKVVCKALFSDRDEYYKVFRKMRLTEIRVLRGVTPSAIDIMGERVLIFTYGEQPSCLSVRNPEIAESFKTFFNNLWGISKA